MGVRDAHDPCDRIRRGHHRLCASAPPHETLVANDESAREGNFPPAIHPASQQRRIRGSLLLAGYGIYCGVGSKVSRVDRHQGQRIGRGGPLISARELTLASRKAMIGGRNRERPPWERREASMFVSLMKTQRCTKYSQLTRRHASSICRQVRCAATKEAVHEPVRPHGNRCP